MSATPNNPTPDGSERLFRRVVQVSSALGLGTMAAFLYALKQVNPAVRFEFSVGVVVAFAAGTAFSWYFWRLAFRLHEAASSRGKLFGLLGLMLGLVTAGAFILGLKNVSGERISDVAVGSGLAIAVLGVLGILLWRIGRFFEDASKEAEERQERDDPPD